MRLEHITAHLAVLALVAGTFWHGPVHAQADDADPEAAADEGEAAGAGAPAPLRPLAIAADGAITAPSGQVVTFVEAIRDPAGANGLAIRFRFLAPGIARSGGKVTADAAQDDMQALCDGYALPQLSGAADPLPVHVIISLSDRTVAFGEADPDATQFFESFRPENGRCIWEAF